MPLLDHFGPPLNRQRDWHGFFIGWAATLTAALNRWLPPNYFAQPMARFGVELFDATVAADHRAGPGWSSPAPMQSWPLVLLSDFVEVQVISGTGGRTVAGAVVFATPTNKDRPEHQKAFLAKNVSYIQQGVGLVVVDIVTQPQADTHAAMLEWLSPAGTSLRSSDLSAAAYRPVRRDDQPQVDIWEEAIAVGRPLPTLPLWLPGDAVVPVELERTYEETRHGLRYPRVP